MQPDEVLVESPGASPRPAGDAPGAGRGGRIFVAVALVGLLGWIGVRVKAAMETQKQVAVQRADVARVATLSATRAPEVAVVRGEAGAWEAVVTLEGSLGPVREADLGFKTPGRMGSVRVRVGDRVRAGTVLATLDSQEASAQHKAADAQVRAAEAQLGLAEDGERRMQAVVSSGAQTEAAGVQARQQRALAAAQLDAARAQKELAQSALANHVLGAPFDGTITRAPTGVGVVVSPGTALFHISDLSRLKLAGTVAEADAPLVKVGAEAVLKIDDREVHGKVTALVAQVDAATKRVPVEVEVVNDPGHPLLAGSFVRARVAGGKAVTVLRLPATALKPGSQDEILVVRNGRTEARRIRFVTGEAGALLVRAGLEPGEDVVLAPRPETKDGEPVQAVPAAGPTVAAPGSGR